MGYVYLLFALTAGITKAYCGKKTGGYLTGYREAMFANILRMFLCLLIGLTIVLISAEPLSLLLDTSVLAICALSGISTSIFVVSWLVCAKNNAYMMLEVFLMLGVTVPLIMGIPFFHETVTEIQWIGMALLCLASLIMCSYNNSIKQKLNAKALFLLILCGVASGMADFSQKLFVHHTDQVPVSVFNLYTYLFSFLTLTLMFMITGKKTTVLESSLMQKCKPIFGYIFVMSICLFANSLFKTMAATYLDSVQLYPLNQGLALILSVFMSAVFFKEKPTIKCIVGLCLAFAGIIMINFLS